MRPIIILNTLFLVSVLILTGAITALVARHQLQAPQWYRDAAISDVPRQPPSTIVIGVAEGDANIMHRRVTNFVTEQGGSVATVPGHYNRAIKARLPEAAGQHISQLHAKRGLSPDYRNWPGETALGHPDSDLTDFTIMVRPIPYRSRMRDWGFAGAVTGGILTIATGMLLVAYVTADRHRNKRDTSESPAAATAANPHGTATS